ncbi:DUF1631 domain-containing protein [Pseudomonas sp. N040]|uniref:DUF1631 domain-containing protein n=1 Tax=Pseudomonas sp. N040 TaxID=2785325 RepID=UPI0018A26E44|nr:DUF1631 domain-containing protein [Pseudomonas sp. N040]MBF7730256.1 DUF1631 domain-containing protein [Pseudomonas sp. N040]MBW7013898.1 DUF1631 domain-containing protein [Pseudomonas sp. N040]
MSNQDTPNTQPGGYSSLASRAIQPRFTSLVQNCKKLVLNQLAEHLTTLFSHVDDTLFECAEKAENNQIQTLFFDNMRDLRRLRPQIERTYHQQIARNLAAFMDGKLKPATKPTPAEANELSLLENEDYEESIQLSNMVNRVRTRAAQSIYPLEQRLALLNNGQKLLEDSNPFGPLAIIEAFRTALAPHCLPLRIKTILYLLFDQHVMGGLDALYAELNKLLIEAGVLPNLKYTARRPPAKPRQAPTARATSASPGQAPADTTAAVRSTPTAGRQRKTGPADSGLAPTDPAGLFADLSSLLKENRQHSTGLQLPGGTPSITSFAPTGATRTYSADELLDALNRLQAESAHDLTQRMHEPQKVINLKASLQRQLEIHSRNPGQQKLADPEADVIDLVGMLFDFILDDTNLPDSCKTILSHLHTPYLKVALLDKALFTQPEHPARKLLNAMAQAGALYGSEGDARGLVAKMRWVVERVIADFAGNLTLFDVLLDEFTEHVATLQHKVELRERRAVEAAKGRDKLLGARQQAAEVITRALQERQPPALIRDFLELTWIDVLVFVLLRHGTDSAEWQRTGEVAEQLAWSGTLLDAGGLLRLQELRLALLEDLRMGLELLGGHHQDGIRQLLKDIVACQQAVQSKQPEVAANLHATLPESPLGAMLGEDAALMKATAQTPMLSSRTQALIQELEQVEPGTWFELTENGKTRILKLSWLSPGTRNYMFVDGSGQRVAIKPVAQLAIEMENGEARIMPQERNLPLVDRALTAIYRILQRLTVRTKGDSK